MSSELPETDDPSITVTNTEWTDTSSCWTLRQALRRLRKWKKEREKMKVEMVLKLENFLSKLIYLSRFRRVTLLKVYGA